MSSVGNNNFKVVLVGSSGVGKTATIYRVVENAFVEDLPSTVGVDYKSYAVDVDGETVTFNLWDTAGQERFRSVSKAYFRNAVGGIIIFSTTDEQSFADIDGWLSDFHALSAPNSATVLVGNKVDLTAERAVTSAEAEAYAQRHNMDYIETSAKDGTGVSDVFYRIAKLIKERIQKGDIQPPQPPQGRITQPVETREVNQGCSC